MPKINYSQAKNQASFLRKKDKEYLELSQAGFGTPNQSAVVNLDTTTKKLLFLLPLFAAALPRSAASEVSRNPFYGNSRTSYNNNPPGKFNATSLDQGKMENYYSQNSPLPAQTFPITVIKEVKHDTSQPLKHIHTKQALAKAKLKKAKKNKWKEKRKKLLLKKNSPKLRSCYSKRIRFN